VKEWRGGRSFTVKRHTKQILNEEKVKEGEKHIGRVPRVCKQLSTRSREQTSSKQEPVGADIKARHEEMRLPASNRITHQMESDCRAEDTC
jgi:hypothetical protein